MKIGELLDILNRIKSNPIIRLKYEDRLCYPYRKCIGKYSPMFATKWYGGESIVVLIGDDNDPDSLIRLNDLIEFLSRQNYDSILYIQIYKEFREVNSINYVVDEEFKCDYLII